MGALQAKHSSYKWSSFHVPFKKEEIFTLFRSLSKYTLTRFLSVYTLLSMMGECTLTSCRVELYRPYLVCAVVVLMEMFTECVCLWVLMCMDLSGCKSVWVLHDLRSSVGSLRLQDSVGESHAKGVYGLQVRVIISIDQRRALKW